MGAEGLSYRGPTAHGRDRAPTVSARGPRVRAPTLREACGLSGNAAVVGVGLAIVATALAGVAAAVDFDQSRYAPAEFHEVTVQYPDRSGVAISPDVPIRTRAPYSGRWRELQPQTRRLLEMWSTAMRVPYIVRHFRRELEVTQGGVQYWVPVQEVLTPAMLAELDRGQTIELYVTYVGQIDGRHLFLLNGFDHEGPDIKR